MGLARGVWTVAGMAVVLGGGGSRQAPTADAGGVYRWTVGRPVRFCGSASLPGAGAREEWDFGDGQRSSGRLASHAYTAPGVYTATLTVASGGSIAIAPAQVTVLPALEEEKVSWQIDGGAIEDEGRLFKAGATEAWDAGAVSSQALSGDGYLEFTAADAHTRRRAGLQARGATNDAAGVELGILLREDGTAQVEDRGVLVGPSVAYRSVDRFRVSVDGGVVRYLHEGRVLHESVVMKPSTATVLEAEPDPRWRVVGAGDFDGNGTDDLLWRHDTSGENRVWLLGGPGAAVGELEVEPDPQWRIAAVADFDGDGGPDLLWQHETGEARVWRLEGLERAGEWTLPEEPEPGWQLEGAADFDGDGRADVLWRHPGLGQRRAWIMRDAERSRVASWDAERDAGRALLGAARFSVDAQADLVWRDAAQQVSVWSMEVGKRVGRLEARLVPPPGAGWDLAAAGDFDGDGRADLAWRQADTGVLRVWSAGGRAAAPLHARVRLWSPGGAIAQAVLANAAGNETDAPAPNRPPVIDLAPLSCHLPCSPGFRALISDPDGDPLTVEWSGCAAGQSGLEVHCPLTAPGTVTATAVVRDNHGNSATDTASASGSNSGPTVSVTVTPAQCHIPCNATFTAAASDPEGDPLTYQWSGCAVGQTGPVAVCPMTVASVYIGRVTVFDPAGAFATAFAQAYGTNQPPTVAVSGDTSCHPPCVAHFQATGSDPEGDALTYRWGGCSAGQTGSQATCAVSAVPPSELRNLPVGSVVVTNFATLATYFAGCNSPAAAGNPECRVAVNRFCDARGGHAGGFGPVEYNATVANVVCLGDDFSSLRLTTFSQLVQHHPGCYGDGVGASSACATASHRWCIAQGYGSGLGPQEYYQQNAMPLCTALSVTREVSTTFPELRNHHPDCNGSTANSLACRVAIDRFCRSRGFAGGFGPTEFDPPGATVTCLPASVMYADVDVSVTADDGRGGQATAETTLRVTNNPPVITGWTATPSTCVYPCTVQFNATATDPDGDALSFSWDGCMSGQTGPQASCQAPVPGTIRSYVTVSDGIGGSTFAVVTAIVQAPPGNMPPVAEAGGPYPAVATRPVTLDGRASTDPENRPLTYNWAFGDGTVGLGPTPVHVYGTAGQFTVTLTVRDDAGATATDTGVVNVAPLDDPDGDGLTTAQEQALGSNPNLADTNGDGVPDGAALYLGLSLTDTDMDDDGVLNAAEIANGTDPFNPDTDGDGANDLADKFPLDPTRQDPQPNPNDHTPPTIQLLKPETAVPTGPRGDL